MELSPGAQEVMIRADELQEETSCKEMCNEHLFYGLVSFLEERDPDDLYAQEQMELSHYLQDKLHKPERALNVLRGKAFKESDKFTDAKKVFKEATKLALKKDRDSDEATATDLALSLILNPTEYTRPFLNREVDFRIVVKDYLKDTREPVDSDDEEPFVIYENDELRERLKKLGNEWKNKWKKKEDKFSLKEWFTRVRRLNIFFDYEPIYSSIRDELSVSVLILLCFPFVLSIGESIFNGNQSNHLYVMIRNLLITALFFRQRMRIGRVVSEQSDIRGFLVFASVVYLSVGAACTAVMAAWNMTKAPLWLRIITLLLFIIASLYNIHMLSLTETCEIIPRMRLSFYEELAVMELRTGKDAIDMTALVGGVYMILWMLSLSYPVWLKVIIGTAAILYVWYKVCSLLVGYAALEYYKKPRYMFEWHREAAIALQYFVPTVIVFFLAVLCSWNPFSLWRIILYVINAVIYIFRKKLRFKFY